MEPTHEEVLALLNSSNFLACDLPDWSLVNEKQHQSYELRFGLLDKTLSRTKFCAELLVQISPETHKKLYKFTLQKIEFKGYTRFYQLEIRWFQNIKTIKSNKHFIPHEHIGRSPEGRMPGDISWLDWSFNEALAYFLKRTKISVDVPPDDPEVFVLKAQK